jgi:hypothetical protein
MVARLALVAALSLGVAGLLGDDRLAAAQQSADPREAAIRLVAAQTGVAARRLAVATTAPARYPALGIVAVAVKVLDTATGNIHAVVLSGTGQPLDATALASGDRTQQAARGVPFEPALAARVADAAPDQPIPVVLWLREPAWSRPPRQAPARTGGSAPAPEVRRALDTAAAADRLAVLRPLVAPVLDRLRAAGVPATAAGSAPAVYASLPPALIAGLSAWPELDRVYLGQTHQPDLDVARPTIRANAVHARGITGQGVQVAQIEPGGRVAAGNPYLAGVVQDPTYVCGTDSEHATAVAGVLRSTHTSLRGIAPGSSLRVGGSCRGLSAELNDRAAAAVDWGARVLNLSYSNDTQRVPTADDRFYDDLGFNRHVLVVKSAGNFGLTTGDVGSPGLGYNVLTVGNLDDRDTTSWTDDLMNPSSSYLGPLSTHGDRLKPELAAPGTNIRSLSIATPWDTYSSSGSSFATPMVAGTAALLLQRNPDLAQWPEAIKAILMATSINPLQGNPTLASRGGAGGLVTDRADDLVQHVNGDWGAQAYSCAAAPQLDVATASVAAGQRVRAVLVWNSDPSWAGWPSQPGADLDLTVVGPGGGAVAVSASLDNSFELVDFVAPTSGEYRLLVSRTRCDSSPTGLAWAWHLPAATAPTVTPTPSPTSVPPTATRTALPPTLTPSPTLSPTPRPLCSPTRPRVGVVVTPGGGRLLVTITVETLPGSSVNSIQALRFGTAANALIDVGTQVGRSGDFSVTLPAPTTQVSFAIRQGSTGSATTVPLTVVDGCGDWATIVGGGPGAF